MAKRPPITCTDVRYIKLGSGGQWDAVALKNNALHFGYGRVPHKLASSCNTAKIKKYLLDIGRTSPAAAEEARQIVDFYRLGSGCLWITFAADHLWWTFAESEVTWHGRSGDGGERRRKCINRWSSKDVNGKPLRIDQLSSRLTGVSQYRRTICAVGDKDYLLRKLNGEENEVSAAAHAARQELVRLIGMGIANLHWRDFETLIDIMFARSGWHRSSALGGTQKAVDLVVEHPTTGERAAVQVKSKADARTIRASLFEIDAFGTFDRAFFVCHTAVGNVMLPPRSNMHLWIGSDLAKMVLNLGLHDWVFAKAL